MWVYSIDMNLFLQGKNSKPKANRQQYKSTFALKNIQEALKRKTPCNYINTKDVNLTKYSFYVQLLKRKIIIKNICYKK